MDIPSLRIFVMAAREGSFTRAAERVHLAQSNVSVAIAGLERELQSPLFVRKKTGVTLTRRGMDLLPLAMQILNLAEEATLMADATPRGTLAISAMESVAVVHLAPLFSRFLGRFPHVQMQLRTADSAVQTDYLRRQLVDCAFLGERLDDEGFEECTVFRDTMMLALPAREKATRIEKVPHLPFLVLQKGCSYRKRLDELLAARAMHATLHEVQGIHSLFACVAAGMGAGLLPESFLVHHEAKRRGVKMVPLPGPHRPIQVQMVWRKGTRNATVVEWVRFVKEAIRVGRR